MRIKVFFFVTAPWFIWEQNSLIRLVLTSWACYLGNRCTWATLFSHISSIQHRQVKKWRRIISILWFCVSSFLTQEKKNTMLQCVIYVPTYSTFMYLYTCASTCGCLRCFQLSLFCVFHNIYTSIYVCYYSCVCLCLCVCDPTGSLASRWSQLLAEQLPELCQNSPISCWSDIMNKCGRFNTLIYLPEIQWFWLERSAINWIILPTREYESKWKWALQIHNWVLKPAFVVVRLSLQSFPRHLN